MRTSVTHIEKLDDVGEDQQPCLANFSMVPNQPPKFKLEILKAS